MQFVIREFKTDADIRAFEEKVLAQITKGFTPQGGIKTTKMRYTTLCQALVLDQTSMVIGQKLETASEDRPWIDPSDVWKPHGDPAFSDPHVLQAFVKYDTELIDFSRSS